MAEKCHEAKSRLIQSNFLIDLELFLAAILFHHTRLPKALETQSHQFMNIFILQINL